MDTIQAINERRSVRKYRPEAIAAAHLRQILEAARLAPSAGNRQPCHFIVVRDQEQKLRLAEAESTGIRCGKAMSVPPCSHGAMSGSG